MKEKMENGDDVNGHLSKLVFKDMNKTDKMLDDWNIYHLHLRLGSPNVFDKARTQSGDLLMAVILHDDAYFIDVTSHSNDDWFDVRYLKIIKDNWEQELLIRHDDIIRGSPSPRNRAKSNTRGSKGNQGDERKKEPIKNAGHREFNG